MESRLIPEIDMSVPSSLASSNFFLKKQSKQKNPPFFRTHVHGTLSFMFLILILPLGVTFAAPWLSSFRW